MHIKVVTIRNAKANKKNASYVISSNYPSDADADAVI